MSFSARLFVLALKYCPILKGHVGLDAEGFRIEVRNLKVKSFSSAPLQ